MLRWSSARAIYLRAYHSVSPRVAALRMASYYSSDELVELDQKIAAAWLVGKLLLAASRGRPNSVSASVSPEVEAGAGPSIRAPPETEGAETGSSANSQGDVDASLSSETKSASLLEDTRKRSHRNHGQNIIPNAVHDFVVGGNVNVNAINLIATANVCRALLDTDLTNPMLFASSVITNVRGYVNDSGAGMESAGKQRKLAKGSDVFAAVYKWLLCGFGGELLAPVFAPYASVAMQIGKGQKHSSDNTILAISYWYVHTLHENCSVGLSLSNFSICARCIWSRHLLKGGTGGKRSFSMGENSADNGRWGI